MHKNPLLLALLLFLSPLTSLKAEKAFFQKIELSHFLITIYYIGKNALKLLPDKSLIDKLQQEGQLQEPDPQVMALINKCLAGHGFDPKKVRFFITDNSDYNGGAAAATKETVFISSEMATFPEKELLGVIAHELSHIKHKDVTRFIIAGILGLIADYPLSCLLSWLNEEGITKLTQQAERAHFATTATILDKVKFGNAMLIDWGIYNILFINLAILLYIRHREKQADLAAARFVPGAREGLIRFFSRFKNNWLDLHHPLITTRISYLKEVPSLEK